MLRAPSWTAGVGAQDTDDDDDDNCYINQNSTSISSASNNQQNDDSESSPTIGDKNEQVRNYIARLFSLKTNSVRSSNQKSSPSFSDSPSSSLSSSSSHRSRQQQSSNNSRGSNSKMNSSETKRAASSNRAKSNSEPDESLEKRPSIIIRVPTAFLATKDASSYHVYQIFVQTKEKEWNVYRRYSQFHALHTSLKTKYNYVAKLDFPPKERINSKTSNTVQLRRKRLEAYLRSLVDYIDDKNSDDGSTQDESSDNYKKSLIEKFNSFILVGSRFEIDASSPIPGNPNVQNQSSTNAILIDSSRLQIPR